MPRQNAIYFTHSYMYDVTGHNRPHASAHLVARNSEHALNVCALVTCCSVTKCSVLCIQIPNVRKLQLERRHTKLQAGDLSILLSVFHLLLCYYDNPTHAQRLITRFEAPASTQQPRAHIRSTRRHILLVSSRQSILEPLLTTNRTS